MFHLLIRLFHLITLIECSKLCAAAEDGDAALVAAMLRSGASVNEENGFGDSALALASAHGHVKVVELLLAAGADVNSRGSGVGHSAGERLKKRSRTVLDFSRCCGSAYGDTALGLAAYNDHLEVVRVLVGAGAEVDRPNRRGNTPLMWAAVSDSDTVVSFLITARALVDRTNGAGDTALTLAAEHGNFETALVLVRNNADVNHQNLVGLTPLMRVAANNEEDIIDLLVDHLARTDLVDNQGRSAMFKAVDGRNWGAVRALLSAGADTVDVLTSTNLEPDKLVGLRLAIEKHDARLCNQSFFKLSDYAFTSALPSEERHVFEAVAATLEPARVIPEVKLYLTIPGGGRGNGVRNE
jgi:ankyrin repeat protein